MHTSETPPFISPSEDENQITPQQVRISGEYCKKVSNYDRAEKALTGRTPEDLYIDSGIEKERLFPEGKMILYVGDPYQVMGKFIDNKNFVTIDYEFGEQTQFIYNEQSFRENLASAAPALVRAITSCISGDYGDDQYSEDQIELLKQTLEKLKKAIELTNNAPYVHDDPEGYQSKYKEVIQAWSDVKTVIVKERALLKQRSKKMKMKEDMELVPFAQKDMDDIWYLCLKAIRGFQDIPDFYEKVWYPLYEHMQEEQKKQGKVFDDKERDEFIDKNVRRFSDPLRLKKKTKESHVVQAMFPALPFGDETFDRFVASWSLSTHVFHRLDAKEFNHTWEVIMRVLKQEGEAFIFPLYYKGLPSESKERMVETLKTYGSENPDFLWELWDIFKNKVDDPASACTLYIKKQKLALQNKESIPTG